MSPRLDSIVVSEVFLEIKSLVIISLTNILRESRARTNQLIEYMIFVWKLSINMICPLKLLHWNQNQNDDNLNAVSRKIISRVLADKCNNGRLLSIFVFSLSLLGNCDQIRIPYYADILSNNVASVIHLKSEHLDAWNIFIEQFIVF